MSSTSVETARQSPLRAAGALAALSMAAFCFVTAESLPIGLLLEMSRSLAVSTSAVGLLVTAYAAVVVVASVPLTLLARRWPRRALLTGLLAVFVLAGVATAVVPDYRVLLVTRVVTALSQAVFWSLALPTAASLFRPALRGRVLAVVLAGSSSAVVIGVPAGTWIGQQAGWRMAFLALAAAGALPLAAIATLLPGSAADQPGRATPHTPDTRRYAALVAVTALGATGAFVSYTYVADYLTEVAGLAGDAIGPALLIRGLAGLAGVALGGWAADRYPRAATAGFVGLQASGLLALFVLPGPAAAVTLTALAGLAFAGFTAVLGPRVLQLAPGSAEVASAGTSTAVNVGIMAGAWAGGELVSSGGPHGTALWAGILSVVALAVALTERRAKPAAGPAVVTPSKASRPTPPSIRGGPDTRPAHTA